MRTKPKTTHRTIPAAHRSVPPLAICSLSFASEQLNLSATHSKRALAAAGIAAITTVVIAKGRRLKVFDRAAVLRLVQQRTYRPPSRGGLRLMA
jgi:hypothetical protein